MIRRLSPRRAATRGFTLVEMAIVLVIVGLIVTGVLVAQQVTQNAKITSAVQSIKSYQAASQSYNQNYGALPGDDAQAATRFKPAPPAGNGDGSIAGVFSTNNPTPTTESQYFWQHLRGAGLIKGAGDSAALPSNPFGGVFGVQNGAFAATGDAADNFAAGTNLVCLNQVPGTPAGAIDQQLDDGKPNSGAIRAATTATSALATSYDPNGVYVLCTPL